MPYVFFTSRRVRCQAPLPEPQVTSVNYYHQAANLICGSVYTNLAESLLCNELLGASIGTQLDGSEHDRTHSASASLSAA